MNELLEHFNTQPKGYSESNWEQRFDEQFTESELAFGTGRLKRNDLKSFIHSLLKEVIDDAMLDSELLKQQLKDKYGIK